MGWMEPLRRAVERFAGELTPEQCAQFNTYMRLLLDWNTRMNLTALRTPGEIAVRHFEDSLSLLPLLPLKEDADVIDIGTGAGFPGVPLKIARPGLRLTLLDSLHKRLLFLEELLKQLGLPAECLHARAEEAGRRTELRERFDAAAARAVAPLRILCEYCLPFVKVGGCFAAMKGPDAKEELEAASGAIAALGGRVRNVQTFTLSDGSGRTIIIIEKISQTPAKYPRNSVKMTKSPL